MRGRDFSRKVHSISVVTQAGRAALKDIARALPAKSGAGNKIAVLLGCPAAARGWLGPDSRRRRGRLHIVSAFCSCLFCLPGLKVTKSNDL